MSLWLTECLQLKAVRVWGVQYYWVQIIFSKWSKLRKWMHWDTTFIYIIESILCSISDNHNYSVHRTWVESRLLSQQCTRGMHSNKCSLLLLIACSKYCHLSCLLTVHCYLLHWLWQSCNHKLTWVDWLSTLCTMNIPKVTELCSKHLVCVLA